MTQLPQDTRTTTLGHETAHAALEADYDARHPDAPLPQMRTMGDHLEIHSILAAELNADTGSDLNTHPEMTSTGHTDSHNLLHAAYNQRPPRAE